MVEHDYEGILGALAHEPGIAVGIVNLEGRVLYATEGCMRVCTGIDRGAGAIIGKTLEEIGYPRESIEERLSFMRTIKETGKEFLVRSIWNGRQIFSWYRALGPTDPESGSGAVPDGEFRVLIVTRPVQAGEERHYLLDDELEVVESRVIDLGPLGVLSARELEVLALIGQGLRTREIAEVLHRSTKTIENHRIALGRKLCKSNRVQLALVARQAGLRVEDAALQRVTHGADEA